MSQRKTVDANEAVAKVAYAASEVIAIYPITPASPMGEHADAWQAQGRKNIFGIVPEVIEMQSEGGAAGTVHGALQAGSLSSTFTASQGLLLMIPNMYKIAGELTPAVYHVAARTLATHALSIFGDHSDVMAVRSTGWAMLCSSSVQEAPDMALIAHAATLRSRIPFLHFFDGFRTSHEVNSIDEFSEDVIRQMLDMDMVAAHRQRGLSPDNPWLRGTAQNPDVFFQAREAINPFYDNLPSIVQEVMDQFAKKTGRAYHLYDYYGDAQAERVIVMMGSGIGAAEEAIDALNKQGERVGLVKIRLYRPLDTERLIRAIPKTTRAIVVLDRIKDPGAAGEPLYQDIVAAFNNARVQGNRSQKLSSIVVGGRYGLASKEFTPAMVKAVFDHLKNTSPMHGFTVGIVDDVTKRSLPIDQDFRIQQPDTTEALFFGLGSDGTVGANKNTVKIIGEATALNAQGYFVYDSKKSGAMTVSHLRISPNPIRATYLIEQANFIACHQFNFLYRVDMLDRAAQGATFLLNSPYDATRVWDQLPREVQQTIIDRRLRMYVVDAESLAREVGLAGRINVIMQVCFFALSGFLPREQAIEHIKEAIKKSYGKLGQTVLDRNYAAVDRALSGMQLVNIPESATSNLRREAFNGAGCDDFVSRVTATILAGHGDLLPVSAMPVDGSFPTGTAKYEKRSIAVQIPQFSADLCIQCGLCSLVCPHAAIRMKAFSSQSLEQAPVGFQHLPWNSAKNGFDRMTVQVAPDDCTGCGVCVDICPARSKEAVKKKAINMVDKRPILERERANFDFFLQLDSPRKSEIDSGTVKGSQFLLPLFEFSGACAGCGETPYVRLLSQLFGDRMVVANATGCSSIYGGNLPTTPWTKDANGRGPSWCNSLFEDNAEFGLGLRLGFDRREATARMLLKSASTILPEGLAEQLLSAPQNTEVEIEQQRERIVVLKKSLREIEASQTFPLASALLDLADDLLKRVVWIIGGDGWAYDIGFGGLDHILASGRNVNVLVLDTEVYSNTGGQSSKSTPRAAVAKFASAGKSVTKKDIGMIAMAYGHVYVAQIAVGAHPLQALKAFHEAESYNGPSLILAYSQCIAHGVDLSTGMTHQKDAVQSGYWPLYRYDPRVAMEGGKPFHLDCRKPTIPFQQFATKEARFSMLLRSDPDRASKLLKLAQADIDDRWHYYEQIANVERSLAGQLGEVQA